MQLKMHALLLYSGAKVAAHTFQTHKVRKPNRELLAPVASSIHHAG